MGADRIVICLGFKIFVRSAGPAGTAAADFDLSGAEAIAPQAPAPQEPELGWEQLRQELEASKNDEHGSSSHTEFIILSPPP